MSAAEIIELIKKLSPEEKAEVLDFARKSESGDQVSERKINFVSDADFDKAAADVFKKHSDLLRRLAQ
jgi:hypothetical protein